MNQDTAWDSGFSFLSFQSAKIKGNYFYVLEILKDDTKLPLFIGALIVYEEKSKRIHTKLLDLIRLSDYVYTINIKICHFFMSWEQKLGRWN